MRHRKSGRQLNRNSSHRKAMFQNMANSLFKHEIIKTTLPKAKELLRMTDASIEIQGHSDNTGSDATNMRVSEARAKAVYSWLIDNGLDQSRLRYKGYGESSPRYSNSTQEGRDKNRRIEFFVDRGAK